MPVNRARVIVLVLQSLAKVEEDIGTSSLGYNPAAAGGSTTQRNPPAAAPLLLSAG